jgi:hypothetical protein
MRELMFGEKGATGGMAAMVRSGPYPVHIRGQMRTTCDAAEDAVGAAVGTVAPICIIAAERAPFAVIDGATAVAGDMAGDTGDARGAGTAVEVLNAALEAELLPTALSADLLSGCSFTCVT